VNAARVAAWILATSLFASCERDAPPSRSAGDSASVASVSTTPAASPSDSLDLWSKSEVVKRLAEAGLVVADSGITEPFPPLTGRGDRLLVSGSELRLYVFPDVSARRAASATLDTVPPKTGFATTWRTRPRVILVNNLVALHFTPNDRLAERVENVLRARHLER
jgi:hypothetical protein